MTPPAASASLVHNRALIVPAAGSSARMGGAIRKPLIEIAGRPILCHTLERFRGINGLDQIILVAHPDDMARIRSSFWRLLREAGATHLVPGGERRQDSVARGLEAVHPDVGIVLIHDAVRPLVPRRAIEESIEAAARYGAAVVAVPIPDTLKRAKGDRSAETVSREDLWAAQTPQVFRTDLIRRAFAEAQRDAFECTDDAQLVERLGLEVKLIRGSYENLKITTPEHLRMAEALLARSATE